MPKRNNDGGGLFCLGFRPNVFSPLQQLQQMVVALTQQKKEEELFLSAAGGDRSRKQ